MISFSLSKAQRDKAVLYVIQYPRWYKTLLEQGSEPPKLSTWYIWTVRKLHYNTCKMYWIKNNLCKRGTRMQLFITSSISGGGNIYSSWVKIKDVQGQCHTVKIETFIEELEVRVWTNRQYCFIFTEPCLHLPTRNNFSNNLSTSLKVSSKIRWR